MTYTSYQGQSILLIFSVYITDKIYFCHTHVKDCKDIVKDNSVKNYITNDVFDSDSDAIYPSSLFIFISFDYSSPVFYHSFFYLMLFFMLQFFCPRDFSLNIFYYSLMSYSFFLLVFSYSFFPLLGFGTYNFLSKCFLFSSFAL